MTKKTNYWFDAEFIEDGKTIDPISIGIVCEDGREFYAENLDADLSKANSFVKEHVIPHLWSQQEDKREANQWSRDGGLGGLLRKVEIRRDILNFTFNTEPLFWTWYGSYDHVVLCQIFGTMTDLPSHFPMFTMDLRQVQEMKGDYRMAPRRAVTHNALEDARWTKESWDLFNASYGLT